MLLSPRPIAFSSRCRLADPEDSPGCVWEGLPVQLLQLPLPLRDRAVPHSHPVGAGLGTGPAKGYGVRWDCGVLLPRPRGSQSYPLRTAHRLPISALDSPKANRYGHKQHVDPCRKHDGSAGEDHRGVAALHPQCYIWDRHPPWRQCRLLPA